jgi:hypothetical protein
MKSVRKRVIKQKIRRKIIKRNGKNIEGKQKNRAEEIGNK